MRARPGFCGNISRHEARRARLLVASRFVGWTERSVGRFLGGAAGQPSAMNPCLLAQRLGDQAVVRLVLQQERVVSPR